MMAPVWPDSGCREAEEPACQGPGIQGSGAGATPLGSRESAKVSRREAGLVARVF